MTTLRDALAVVLRDVEGNPNLTVGDFCPVADTILTDPAFRAALTESIAEALTAVNGATPEYLEGMNAARWYEREAAAIVARMLGEEP